MTQVSLIHGASRRENIKKALTTLPYDNLARIQHAERIFIKPNLVHHRNQLASTHLDAVRGVIDIVREHSRAPITVGDSSYHGTKAAFRSFGYENLLNEYADIALFDLNDDETVPGFYMKRDGSKGSMGFSRRVTEADFTISLANLKMHRDTGVTLATKNWTIGTWVPEARFGAHGKYWPRWPYLHEEGPFAHNATIAELLNQLAPNLAVIDGFVGMEGDGPTRGEPVPMGVALAGADCIAVDTIATGLMGVDSRDIGYLAIATERGYGKGDNSQIELFGETDPSQFRKEFAQPADWGHVLAWKQNV